MAFEKLKKFMRDDNNDDKVSTARDELNEKKEQQQSQVADLSLSDGDYGEPQVEFNATNLTEFADEDALSIVDGFLSHSNGSDVLIDGIPLNSFEEEEFESDDDEEQKRIADVAARTFRAAIEDGLSSDEPVDVMGDFDAVIEDMAKDDTRVIDDKEFSEEERLEVLMQARMSFLADVALHYYLSNYRSWLEAYMNAIDEIPALCLIVPGSPIEYVEINKANAIAAELGYDDYATMAAACEAIMEKSPFMRIYAENTLLFARNLWFAGEEAIPLSDYVNAIASEMRANWPASRTLADNYFKIVLDSDSDGPNGIISGGFIFDEKDGDPKSAIIGIQEVDERSLIPKSLALCPFEDYQELLDTFVRYNKTKLESIDADAGDLSVFSLDEDIIALTSLQCYAWSDRSWVKSTEFLQGFLNNCFTFCWAMVSPEFVIPDEQAVQEHEEELEELAQELMNENGEVELRRIKDGSPMDPECFDAQSRRFIELAEERRSYDLFNMAQENISNIIGGMAGTKNSVADMMVDEIITSVYAMSDLTNPTSQVKALEAIRAQTLEEVEKSAKRNKSRWKKALKDPYVSEMVKNAANIVGVDENGLPEFSDNER